MSDQQLTTGQRIILIRAAIDHVKAAQARHRSVEMDPTSTSDDRSAAKEHYQAAEREFGWQWKNVEAILDALAKGAQS